MWRSGFNQFRTLLKHNRFFTFLSLFGISFTVIIVLLITVKIENSINPGGPEKNNDNMLFVDRQWIKGDEYMSMGGVSQSYINQYILPMTSPKAIAFYSEDTWSYIGNRGVEDFTIKNCSAGMWEVFDFEFLSGRSFTLEHQNDEAPVIVIDQTIGNRFFPDEDPVGKQLEISGVNYSVIGMVKDISKNCTHSSANIYIPYTLTAKGVIRDAKEPGNFSIAFLGDRDHTLSSIKEEYATKLHILNETLDGEVVGFSGPETALGSFLINASNRGADQYKGHTVNIINMILKILLLMLLPAINLISIQLTRVHERAEEIGIRKTYGATKRGLINQILYENTLLTFLGALIGLIITFILVYGLSDWVGSMLFNNLKGDISMKINVVVLIVTVLSVFIISFISGIIPAMRMSKVEPAQVLEGGLI